MGSIPRIVGISSFVMLVSALILAQPSELYAHCDGMDGPVVSAAQRALETGNVNLILIWVKKDDEAEIRRAFEKTVAVRRLGPEARQMADHYFFETLVRTHRAGEGAPYTGLKPAGRDLGPAIPAADKALETGSPGALLKLLTESVDTGVRSRFAAVQAAKAFDVNDAEAGRKYVEAYVSYIHYAEEIYEASRAAAHGHYPEAHEGRAPEVAASSDRP